MCRVLEVNMEKKREIKTGIYWVNTVILGGPTKIKLLKMMKIPLHLQICIFNTFSTMLLVSKKGKMCLLVQLFPQNTNPNVLYVVGFVSILTTPQGLKCF